MTVRASRFTVGTAVVRLDGAIHLAGSANGSEVLVRNRGAGSIFLDGDDDLTTSSGFELQTGEDVSITLEPGDRLYAVAASEQTVHVLEAGL